MIDYCPNCGSKDIEKLSDTEIYCEKCDQTFQVTKGKAVAKPVGRITNLEDRIKVIEEDTKIIKKKQEEFF